MREVERVIDSKIASLHIWGVQREVLLLMTLNHYKDGMSELSVRFMHGRLFGNEQSIRIGLLREHSLHSGVLQVLKWIMEFAHSEGHGSKPNVDELEGLFELGKQYEMIIDLLKMAKHDRVAIRVDRDCHIVSVYEGGDLTGADNQLIEHQVDTLPYYSPPRF